MGLLSAIFKLIKKLIKRVIAVVKKVIEKLGPLLLVLAAVWFAPAIGTWLASVGLPGIGSAFSWIGTTITPHLTSAGAWLWDGAKALGGAAWTAFKGAELSTQASIIAGAAMLLAPDETLDVLTEAAEVVGEIGGALVGGVAGSIFSNPVVLIGGGLALFLLLSHNKEKET